MQSREPSGSPKTSHSLRSLHFRVQSRRHVRTRIGSREFLVFDGQRVIIRWNSLRAVFRTSRRCNDTSLLHVAITTTCVVLSPPTHNNSLRSLWSVVEALNRLTLGSRTKQLLNNIGFYNAVDRVVPTKQKKTMLFVLGPAVPHDTQYKIFSIHLQQYR